VDSDSEDSPHHEVIDLTEESPRYEVIDLTEESPRYEVIDLTEESPRYEVIDLNEEFDPNSPPYSPITPPYSPITPPYSYSPSTPPAFRDDEETPEPPSFTFPPDQWCCPAFRVLRNTKVRAKYRRPSGSSKPRKSSLCHDKHLGPMKIIGNKILVASRGKRQLFYLTKGEQCQSCFGVSNFEARHTFSRA
jgi:hypothetical protein